MQRTYSDVARLLDDACDGIRELITQAGADGHKDIARILSTALDQTRRALLRVHNMKERHESRPRRR